MNLQAIKLQILDINKGMSIDAKNAKELISTIIFSVDEDNNRFNFNDFVYNVAKSVLKYGRVSEKQAYVIAKGISESGMRLV